MDELIAAQNALEERIKYNQRGYYINITMKNDSLRVIFLFH